MISLIVSQNNIKGLGYIEKWIPRKKDRSKLRVCIYKSINLTKNVPGELWIHGRGYYRNS